MKFLLTVPAITSMLNNSLVFREKIFIFET